MTFWTVFIRKGDTEITQCFESPHKAVEWLSDGFIASLDDDNVGVEYAVRTETTDKEKP